MKSGMIIAASFVLVRAAAPSPMGLPVGSAELIERAAEFDRRTVEYQGEAVGDVMMRGEFAWVNLYDGKNAIGVWCPRALAGMIRCTGDYWHTGDTLRVSGVFHRACPEHGGDLDIHALALEKTGAGGRRERPFPRKKALAAAGISSLAAVLYLLNRFRRRS